VNHSHARQSSLFFQWPNPPLQVALVEPEIPPNTGNIARLCAATQSPLHLVGNLGFRLTDTHVRRAGLDYWDSVNITRHPTLPDFESSLANQRAFFFSTRGNISYSAVTYRPGDVLVFGSESRGLPDDLLDRHPGNILTIPMYTNHVRSLNLATSVGIVLYEALRQINASSPCSGDSTGIQ
jgi:tRNA (cytidine/uridine-2'-O-)-methyltransferase